MDGVKGLLRNADCGTLFLDELGVLGLEEQALLLRALEDKRFMPLGSDKEVTSDFQLLAGTNLDLPAEVAAGRFRADLYARIGVWSFNMPSLSHRPEDIEPNVEHELARAGAAIKGRVRFDPAAKTAYLAFAKRAPWPGNFRDLAASMMRMVTLAEQGRITSALVRREIDRLDTMWGAAAHPNTAVVPGEQTAYPLAKRIFGANLDWYQFAQREVVLQAIRETRTMAEAGRKLFAVSRNERSTQNDSHRVKTMLDSWGCQYHALKVALAEA